MIVLDANLLLYAYDSSSARHQHARELIERLFSSDEPVGLPWLVIAAFLRVTTNARLQRQRFTVEEAVAVVTQWLECPNVRALGPGEDHWLVFQDLLKQGQARGPLVSDAEIAAITIENGGTLYSTDRDFARFSSLRCKDPLGS